MDVHNRKRPFRKCCVPKCTGRTKQRHYFPSDLELCRKWLQNVGNLNLKNLPIGNVRASYAVVCDKHFAADDFVPGFAGELRTGAVPTLFLPSEHERKTHIVDVCRACLSPKSVTNMYKLKYQGVSYVQIYETVTSIKVKPTDKISQSLCKTCFAAINRFYVFQKNCLRSEKMLTDMMEADDKMVVHRPIKFEDSPISNGSKSPQIDNRNLVVCYRVVSNSDRVSAREDLEIVNNTARTDGDKCNNSLQTTDRKDLEPVCNTARADSVARTIAKLEQAVYRKARNVVIYDTAQTGDVEAHLNNMISILTEHHYENGDADRILRQGIPRVEPERKRLKIYSCFCGKNFIDSKIFFKHCREEKHNFRRYYLCPQCPKKFPTPSALRDHMPKHTKEKRFVCDTCGKAFGFEATLSRHVRTKHQGLNRFVCDTCGLELTTSFVFEEHLRSHTGETPYLCDYCGKLFSKYATYKQHLKAHADAASSVGSQEQNAEPNYQCDVCKKIYRTKSGYDQHKNKHREKRHFCSHCGEGFVFKSILRDHVNKHTGARPHLCKVCGNRYATLANLHMHKTKHSEKILERNKCHVCGKRNQNWSHLKRHLMVHTGEKPFKCTFCPKAFAAKADLRAHVNAHKGVKPYSCDVCTKAFYDVGIMKKHRKIKHPDAS